MIELEKSDYFLLSSDGKNGLFLTIKDCGFLLVYDCSDYNDDDKIIQIPYKVYLLQKPAAAGAATMGAMLLAFNAPPGSLPLVIALWNGGLLLVWRYGPHRFTVWREALKICSTLCQWQGWRCYGQPRSLTGDGVRPDSGLTRRNGIGARRLAGRLIS